ncbi:hypothetical protein HMSSN036_36120 [Paenibacillus macerans]|nr:hypothetical protein HMSSN036_36120 [Paenibacillus macerans]
MESNGSTSQASICASTLAMMDAGVPIKAPVAGVAMGLIKDGEHVSILTDIQGMEDHLGDMDFKVAGTAEGVTAIQMDIKIDGIDRQILTDALKQAREGRMFILAKMMERIQKPKEHLSPYAPKILIMNINPDKIRDVIGAGGKIINKIIEETGVKIDIEQDGRVFIASANEEMNNKARSIIEGIVKEVVVGEIYVGTVKRIEKFGAFVEIFAGQRRAGSYLPAFDGACRQSGRRRRHRRYGNRQGDRNRQPRTDQSFPQSGFDCPNGKSSFINDERLHMNLRCAGKETE